MIKGIYREYFQKSRVFLYPALEITNKTGITPIGTYLAWKDKGITAGHKKLIAVFHARKDREFHLFENSRLRAHKWFLECIETEDPEKGELKVFIFDLSKTETSLQGKKVKQWSLSRDWDLFLQGRYSVLSKEIKLRIKSFFKPSHNKYVYVESFLEPSKYYVLYAEILGVPVSVLKEATELTDRPDLKKETLELKIKKIKIKTL